MANLSYAGQFSGYLPQATGQVVAFVRKREDFALNDYIQWVPTEATLGTYTVLERDQFVRVVNSGDQNRWEDGDERPRHDAAHNKIRFKLEEFRTYRNDYGWTLGYKTLEQTKLFKLKPAHMDMAISQSMTDLCQRIWTTLQTASTWGSNTADANALNGGKGKWSDASDDPSNAGHYNAILLTLQNAAQRINIATNGKVKPTDLRVVVNPEAAIAIAASAEMRNYCRESPAAREILEKGLDPQFQLWGLPSTYNGYKFVVEDAVVVNEYPKEGGTEATANRTYVKNKAEAIIVSRPGSLDGEYGARTFSTVQVYHYGAITQVEAFDDPRNRRVEGHVSTDLAVVVPAAVAGFRVTGIV